jgi:hypothetical protein
MAWGNFGADAKLALSALVVLMQNPNQEITKYVRTARFEFTQEPLRMRDTINWCLPGWRRKRELTFSIPAALWLRHKVGIGAGQGVVGGSFRSFPGPLDIPLCQN